LNLTTKEFDLLLALLRRQGEIISRATLAEEVWGKKLETDANVIQVTVQRLRSKLDDPFDLKLLHTVRGVGYVLEDNPCGSNWPRGAHSKQTS
jgi:two-component system copper resistance phosphate regulon response regulator CusR